METPFRRQAQIFVFDFSYKMFHNNTKQKVKTDSRCLILHVETHRLVFIKENLS